MGEALECRSTRLARPCPACQAAACSLTPFTPWAFTCEPPPTDPSRAPALLSCAQGSGPRPEGAPPVGASAQPGGAHESRLEVLVLQLMQQASALGQALQEESAQRIALEKRLEVIEQALQQAQGRGQG